MRKDIFFRSKVCLCEGLWRQSYRKKVVNSFVRTIFSNKMKSICLVKWCPHCIFNILLFSRGEFCIEIIDTSIMNMLIGKWHKMTHFLSIFCKIENKKNFSPYFHWECINHEVGGVILCNSTESFAHNEHLKSMERNRELRLKHRKKVCPRQI